MSSILTIPAIIESIKTRRDNTIALTIATNELSPEKAAELFGHLNKYVYLAVKIAEFNKKELDAISSMRVDYDDQTKSNSQRLRGVLFRNYELDAEGFKSFELYYNYKMEHIITHFKGKLP